MTTANPSHVRPSSVAQAWRTFRRWRRSRPFWGGLFTILAGVEMFASTRMTINGLSFHSGATGLLSLLIPVILVSCGVLLWFTPAQRLFYSIVAAVTAVYALIGLNLGGFFVGLLLGIVGSALAFAWTPTRPASAAPTPTSTEPAVADPADADSTVADPADADSTVVVPADAESTVVVPAGAGEVPQQPDERRTERGADSEPAGIAQAHATDGRTASVADPDADGSGRAVDPRTFGVALVVLGLATAVLAAQPRPVQAAPTLPVASVCPTPSRPATPSPSASAPTATPAPSASPHRDGNIVTDILDGIGDLLTGGHRREAATPTTSPTAPPSAKPTATPTPRPGATACPTPGRPGRPGATPPGTAKPGTVEPGKPLPRIAADPNLPRVAQTPSKLTGSSVRMTGLRFEGITDLQTEKGTLKVLKFSMGEAVTDDFLLSADGPQGRNQRYATDRLTVSGDVAFYATRFVGRLLGIKITLTPDLPLPNGLPVTSPIPITFTDPVIDLAYVTSNTLTATPALALTLA
ncbi:DUF6114 domain-containing protein [Micromonospora sp. MH99]|uniref:DUF6114 domain-containing protein n=1 Tax=Micromonospora sp. MH99 TaxID=1945510 RepID=UPI001F1CC92B|nr:DUF6114 domain-containing protein [Micromonospora sp. MH99]